MTAAAMDTPVEPQQPPPPQEVDLPIPEDEINIDDLSDHAFKNLGEVRLAPRALTTDSQARRLEVLKELAWTRGVEVHLVEMTWVDHPERMSDELKAVVSYDGDRKILFLDYRFSKLMSRKSGYRNSQSKKGDWSRYDCKFAIEMAWCLAVGMAPIRLSWPAGTTERARATNAIYRSLIEAIAKRI